MESHLLQSLMVLSLALVASHAVDPEVYFKTVLPNTPIPKAIKDSLLNARSTSYVVGKPKANFPRHDDAASNEQIMGMKTSALFVLEKDMRVGKSINLHIGKDTTATPDSIDTSLIKKTVAECEKASNQGEDQYCATSLESMVDFASSKLGKKVKAVSTQVDGNESTSLQGYKVEEVKKLNGDNVVVCHQEYYATAVHYCHKSSKINAYIVSLVGENNVRAKAISVCHEDTASWNPKHLAFQVLNVKPGTYAVCHFLVENDVAWVPY